MLGCVVTSADETVHYDQVRSVTVPSVSGQAQILSGHAETFMVLKKGDVRLEKSNQSREVISIVQGECYVRNDKVVIVL